MITIIINTHHHHQQQQQEPVQWPTEPKRSSMGASSGKNLEEGEEEDTATELTCNPSPVHLIPLVWRSNPHAIPRPVEFPEAAEEKVLGCPVPDGHQVAPSRPTVIHSTVPWPFTLDELVAWGAVSPDVLVDGHCTWAAVRLGIGTCNKEMLLLILGQEMKVASQCWVRLCKNCLKNLRDKTSDE